MSNGSQYSHKGNHYVMFSASAHTVLDSTEEAQPMDIGLFFETGNHHHTWCAFLFEPLCGRDGPWEEFEKCA
jgi:hypothetical protein